MRPRSGSIDEELEGAVEKRRAFQAAVERGEATAADPRAAREAELKRKQKERLGGKRAPSFRRGSPRATKGAPLEVTL